MRGRAWAWAGLGAVLVFDVWWRGHTVGPTVRERLGLNLYPISGAASEPLDCDEAVYAYIGKRITRGAVMYRDMTENKPPGGYWAYALAVALGGADELTVRLMPLPLVLATIGLVWWLALRLRGPGAAVVAALSYAFVSTDPFLYGNGANMEHLINLAATASLALMVGTWPRSGRGRLLTAGACLGASALVKQVALLHGVVYAAALFLRREVATPDGPRKWGLRERLIDVAALAGGCLTVGLAAAAVVIAQGAGSAAVDDVIRYGAASATDIPADPSAPPFLVRWVTGNADPNGRLPWPFGSTNYLVWWGTGSWPFWLAAIPALFSLGWGRRADGPRRLVVAWTVSAWFQVALPRHFWQHYYLLPLPGLAVAVAVYLGDQIARLREPSGRRGLAAVAVGLTVLALASTARIQVRDYLLVTPEELTIRDKGGRQWVALRALAREITTRTSTWRRPTLFVWGWQSPLYFYSGLEPVTPQLFADDLIKAHAGGEHPLIRRRVDRMMADLSRDPPSLVFTGYPPFPALKAFLNQRYLPSRLAPGLWVERTRYGAFEVGGSAR